MGSPASIPFRLRLMVCLLLPRMLRRRPRRLWLMLLVLLMNSVLSRNMFLPLELERTLFPMLLENLRDVFLMLRILPSSLAKPPWLSLKERSVSSRLSLPAPSPALERPPRLQRAERKAKELAFAQGEDKKNQDRMSELASKLQMKIKTYKQQIEEAEEIAALNLAKFRKAQQELEETEERAKLAMVI